MSESLRSPNVYNPKSILEVLYIKSKNPDTVLWGGGTFLMSRTNYYPNAKAQDIIRLNSVSELSRIQHSDRFIEAGSMVTIKHLLNNGASFLSQSVIKALKEIGNSVIIETATLGGSLATPDFRTSISCVFSTIGAIVELRFFNRKNYSRWIPVSKLYDVSGNYLFEDKAIITRVRIPSLENHFAQLFTTLEPPLKKDTSSVSLGLQYTVSQGNIAQPTVCISYPKAGFIFSGEIENKINSINLPVNPQTIKSVTQQIEVIIKKSCPAVSDIQLERTRRLFEKVFFDINTKYLAG